MGIYKSQNLCNLEELLRTLKSINYFGRGEIVFRNGEPVHFETKKQTFNLEDENMGDKMLIVSVQGGKKSG